MWSPTSGQDNSWLLILKMHQGDDYGFIINGWQKGVVPDSTVNKGLCYVGVEDCPGNQGGGQDPSERELQWP